MVAACARRGSAGAAQLKHSSPLRVLCPPAFPHCLPSLPPASPTALPPAAGHGLGSDEARLAVASLQCLQRLAGASVVASGRAGSAVVGMSQIIGAAGGSGRIFASLMSGHDHVAAESARLLLRFFSPAAARAGAGPWTALPPGGGGEVGGSGGTAVAAEVGEDEAAAVHSAKSVCFISHSRSVRVCVRCTFPGSLPAFSARVQPSPSTAVHAHSRATQGFGSG